MLLTEFFEGLFDGFLIILALPIEVIGQYAVQDCGRVLPVPPSIFLQLRHTLRLEAIDAIGLSVDET
jgi:hypothetical protein